MISANTVIGHRGACAYAPENTFASFNRAFLLGCRFIEFDVMCSADGEPFIFHDTHLKRTTNGKGELGQALSNALPQLDAGSWFSKEFTGERIPHLKEVIHWLIFANMQANIEIKPYPGTLEQTTLAVLSHVQRFWPHNKPLPLISSFEWEALALCHTIAPEMPLALLVHEWRDDYLYQAKQLHCYALHVNKQALTKERVKHIKEQGFALCVYTVNQKRQAQQLFEWGADAVFSDYPDLCQAQKSTWY